MIIIRFLLAFVRAFVVHFCGGANLSAENAVLKQQLAAYQRREARPDLKPQDRVLWVILSKVWRPWSSMLVFVKPATVIRWHNWGYRKLWGWKSRKPPGRPAIDAEHIALIERISSDHPEWGEDKIEHEMAIKLGVEHSPATVRKYKRKPLSPTEKSQRWQTFITNHAKEILACDFVVQYTVAFKVFYIFVLMELDSRRIVYFNITDHPTLPWVKQQIREATAGNAGVRFLIHDNDGIYGQYRSGGSVDNHGRKYRSNLDRWLQEVMGIKGVPIPYGAPRANGRVERFAKTLRTEALDHFIFLGEQHIRRVVGHYTEYYSKSRPSQATRAIPAPWPELQNLPKKGKVIALPILGGLHHDYRRAAA